MHSRVDVEFTEWQDGAITRPGFYRAVADGEEDITCIEVRYRPNSASVERVHGIDDGYPNLEDWSRWIGPYGTGEGALMAWCPPIIENPEGNMHGRIVE